MLSDHIYLFISRSISKSSRISCSNQVYWTYLGFMDRVTLWAQGTPQHRWFKVLSKELHDLLDFHEKHEVHESHRIHGIPDPRYLTVGYLTWIWDKMTCIVVVYEHDFILRKWTYFCVCIIQKWSFQWDANTWR